MKAILIDKCNNCPHADFHYVVNPYKGYEIRCKMASTDAIIKIVGMSDQIEKPPTWCPLQNLEDMGITDEGITVENSYYKFTISGKTWQARMPRFVWKEKE